MKIVKDVRSYSNKPVLFFWKKVSSLGYPFKKDRRFDIRVYADSLAYPSRGAYTAGGTVTVAYFDGFDLQDLKLGPSFPVFYSNDGNK